MARPTMESMRRRRGVLAALAAVAAASIVFGATRGTVSIPLSTVMAALAEAVGLPVEASGRANDVAILTSIRIPRVFAGWWAGACLAIAGVLLQGSFRSRLAEPATAGASAGGLLGAAAALVVAGSATSGRLDAAVSVSGLLVRMLLAGLGAWAATLIVWASSRAGGRIASGSLLLSGMAVNAIVGSVAASAIFLGSIGTQTAATVIVGWVFGGLLAQAGGHMVVPLMLATGGGLVAAFVLSRPLDQILVGEQEAASAGVPVVRIRHAAVAAAAFVVGAATAVVGVVALVGLLAPAVVRRWTGPATRASVVAAALAGGSLLVVADAVGRTVASPGEMPAGILTALAGAPVLLVMMRRLFGGGRR